MFSLENMNTVLCVAFLLLVGDGALLADAKTSRHIPSDQRGSINDRGRPLSVLLVPTADPGHLMPMSALGAALVHRGHNVTLCTTKREGDDSLQQLAERTGMTWISAGPDNLATLKNKEETYGRRQNMYLINAGMKSVQDQSANAGRIVHTLQNHDSWARTWDIVIADKSFAEQLACLSMNCNIPIMLLSPSLDVSVTTKPHWPFPVPGSKFTDDMTFSQRLISILLFSYGVRYFEWYSKTVNLPAVLPNCKQFHHKLNHIREGYIPAILATVIGFEYPHPLLPMMHYVGPLVLRTEEIIPVHMDNWLAKQREHSVIYISMGSGARLTKDQGSALANGAMQTNYSILWSLRASNRDILEGLSLDKQRFYISEWIPQRAVLQNKAIALAALHGGMGGVGEALFNAVPLVVIPFGFDQYAVAARVQHAGTGVYLDKNTLTANEVKVAIETVGSHASYIIAAKKLQKIIQQAGGPQRAAELVEFYADVGYEHLFPAYLKYQWNWVQYYNADVYTLLAVTILTPPVIIFTLCRCCFHKRKVKIY